MYKFTDYARVLKIYAIKSFWEYSGHTGLVPPRQTCHETSCFLSSTTLPLSLRLPLKVHYIVLRSSIFLSSHNVHQLLRNERENIEHHTVYTVTLQTYENKSLVSTLNRITETMVRKSPHLIFNTSPVSFTLQCSYPQFCL